MGKLMMNDIKIVSDELIHDINHDMLFAYVLKIPKNKDGFFDAIMLIALYGDTQILDISGNKQIHCRIGISDYDKYLIKDNQLGPYQIVDKNLFFPQKNQGNGLEIKEMVKGLELLILVDVSDLGELFHYVREKRIHCNELIPIA